MKILLKRKMPERIMTIVNVYAPQSGRLRESCIELDEMYSQLNDLMTEYRKQRHLVFIAGYLNAKVGEQYGNTICMCRYSRGVTNLSGNILIDFYSPPFVYYQHCLQKTARHITKWQSIRQVNDSVVKVFNQIDYILCKLNTYSATKQDFERNCLKNRSNRSNLASK